MFGKKVKELRLQKGMTQKELAKRLGISTRSLINYETGRCYPRQASIMADLAELLQVSADYLLSDDQAGPACSAEQAGAEAERLVKELLALFAGGKMSPECRDKVLESMQNAYWDARRLEREQHKKADPS